MKTKSNQAAQPANAETDTFVLRLYVAGQTPKSMTAFANLKNICEEHLAGRYQIEVVDLLENPQLAQRRPDPCHPDSGAETAGAGAQDHRRSLQHRARADRAGSAAAGIGGISCQTSKCAIRLKSLNDRWSVRQEKHYVLRLYVTGTTPQSVRAITNIKKICEEHLKGRYELEVIDLYQQPQLAQGEQIIAAPTLIKKLPLPLRRIIGDMSKTERVLVGLDLRKKA